MLQNPDVSETQIVFAYGGDLWIVAKDGGNAVKLSSPKGQELFPKFSPRWISDCVQCQLRRQF